MNLNKNSVLLCKATHDSHDDADPYEVHLQRNGFSVKIISPINFVYKMSIDKTLNDTNKYSGIIFTSPRSVIGFEQLIKNDPNWWNDLRIYVVGNGTARMIKSNSNLKILGEETGNASDLADLIIADHQKLPFQKPLLFPCGNLKMDTLPNKLENENIPFLPAIVYETIPNKHFVDRFIEFTHSGKECSEYMVFFSPSGIKLTKPILEKLKLDLQKIKFIAIGPTTEKAMGEYNIKASGVARKPTPEALIDALKLITNLT